jgi:hypothetical protein
VNNDNCVVVLCCGSLHQRITVAPCCQIRSETETVRKVIFDTSSVCQLPIGTLSGIGGNEDQSSALLSRNVTGSC